MTRDERKQQRHERLKAEHLAKFFPDKVSPPPIIKIVRDNKAAKPCGCGRNK